MGDLLDYLPIAAAAFAIPQFLPQLRKLRATNDTAGVSWSWATLTSVNNAAWFAYFAASAYWAALVPATSATLLAGMLAIMLAQRGQARARPAVLISGWVTLLVAGFAVAGRAGLGTLLTVAFILQVTPSLWTAYRSAHLSGVAAGTWLLILGELSCWTILASSSPTHACSPWGSPVSPPARSCWPASATHAEPNRSGGPTHTLIRTGLPGSAQGNCPINARACFKVSCPTVRPTALAGRPGQARA